ncbi:MAG: phage protein [Xanthomonadaceae bacterium]|nr:phage protein [Xanthomonadaceae bacterium]
MTAIDNLIRPPCWPTGTPCPNTCAAAHHDRTVRNHLNLTGPWAGWRLAGRDLISPHGHRINPERLTGLIWRSDATDIRDKARSRKKAKERQLVKVVIVSLAEYKGRQSAA